MHFKQDHSFWEIKLMISGHRKWHRTWGCGLPGTEHTCMIVNCGVKSWKRQRSSRGKLHAAAADDDDDDDDDESGTENRNLSVPLLKVARNLPSLP